MKISGLEHVPERDRALVSSAMIKWTAVADAIKGSAYELALAGFASTVVVVCGG